MGDHGETAVMSSGRLPPYSDRDEGGDRAWPNLDASGAADVKLRDKTETTLPGCGRDATRLPSNLEYHRDGRGNIICTDAILDDPVYFSAFVQLHGSKPPDVKLKVAGHHWEEDASGPDTSDGNTVKSSRRHLVRDFDFDIALTSEILIRRNGNAPPYYFTYRPEVATYRNSTLKRRQNEREEQARLDDGLSVGQQAIVQYLSSTKPLKEFRFEKVVAGWDMDSLRTRITTIVRRTGYRHPVEVTLVERENYLYVRPSHPFSRIYRHPVTELLRWLVFPVGLLLLLADYVWLGAYWRVLGARYDLHGVDPVTGEERGMSADRFLVALGDTIARAAREGEVGSVLAWPAAG